MNVAQPGGLYPIIRRLRRPLIIEDDDATAAPAPSPPVSAGEGVSYAEPLTPSPKAKDAKRATRERV
jgi:hypothetical protein